MQSEYPQIIPNPRRDQKKVHEKVIPAHIAAGIEPVKADFKLLEGRGGQFVSPPPRPVSQEQKPIIKTENVGKNFSSTFTNEKVFIPAQSYHEDDQIFVAPIFNDEFDLGMLEQAEKNLNQEVFYAKDSVGEGIVNNRGVAEARKRAEKNTTPLNIDLNKHEVVTGEYFILLKNKVIFKHSDAEEIESYLFKIIFEENSEYEDMDASELTVYKKCDFRAGVRLL